MSVEDKLVALSLSTGKQLPIAGILLDAVQTERSTAKQKNLEEVVERLVHYVDELKLKVSIDSEPETSQLLTDILKEVEDEYEPYTKEAYSNLLFHVVTDRKHKDEYFNILYQLKQMNGKDISNFISMYAMKIYYREKFKGVSMKEAMQIIDPNMTVQKLDEIEKLNGIDLNNYEVDGPSHINEDDYNKVTIKKFESIGLLNVPRHVQGFKNPSEMYKPNLTKEADDFYKFCIKEPSNNI